MNSVLFVTALLAVAKLSLAQNGTDTSTPQPTTVTSTPQPTTTPPVVPCENKTTCDTCVSGSGASCLWCNTQAKCHTIVEGASDFFKLGSKCGAAGLGDARWLNCQVNMLAVIIAGAVIGGILLLSITVCICCCCCKSSTRQKLKWKKEDVRLEAAKEERRQKFEERRAERKAKNDEIRKKYGLLDESGGSSSKGYQRFGNED